MGAAWILTAIPSDFVGGSILISGLLFVLSVVFIPFALRKRAQENAKAASAQTSETMKAVSYQTSI